MTCWITPAVRGDDIDSNAGGGNAGGDGIADDGDGDDSDRGEDKLHDGGKLHDTLSHECSMPDTPFPRVS